MFEELETRLRALSESTANWLLIDRSRLRLDIARAVLANYQVMPSPDAEHPGETGVGYLRRLLDLRGDHALYEAAMQQLEGEIYSAVCALSADEQIALLLPMVGDMADMFADRDIAEWPAVLRSEEGWQRGLRATVEGEIRRTQG